MAQLVYQEKGNDRIFPLDKDEVVLGRSPKADVTVSDYGVSRFHAKIRAKGGGFVIQDLESRNGTKVNDVLVTEAQLNVGDRITLGNFNLTLQEEESAEPEVELDDGREISETSGTIIRSHEELKKLLEAAKPDERVDQPPRLDEIEKSNRILRMLTQVAKALISEDSLEGTLTKVMDLVFENIPCERGVLGLYDDGRLTLKQVRYRKERAEGEKITIPKAITNKVRDDRVSILTMDAQQDQRFDSSHSILMLGIRSAMCVPLWDAGSRRSDGDGNGQGGNVVGIIYVDEDIRAGTFNTNDLDLLSALANYAAVAIERARLNQEIQAEQATREKLARYHSPGVIEQILKGGENPLDMQERYVTVCFADIVGFTSMAENLEPREVGNTINEFFTELTECIFRHEGTLDKYIGDSIMAVFGAPLAQPDNALRAVRAALEMLAAVDKLNAERPPDQRLQLRTGINTGQVVAGDIGSPKRKDYSVLGDPVNIASRLESSVARQCQQMDPNQPGWIVIGESTYAAVKDYFEFQPMGRFTVKGKSREIAAYRVLGEKSGVFTN